MGTHLSLMPFAQKVRKMPPQHRVPLHAQRVEAQPNSRQGRHDISIHAYAQTLRAQRGLPFYSNQNLHHTEKHNGILRNTNAQGTLSYPLLLCEFPLKQTTYCRKKGKQRESIFLFPFSATQLCPNTQLACWQNVHVSRSETKPFEFCVVFPLF